MKNERQIMRFLKKLNTLCKRESVYIDASDVKLFKPVWGIDNQLNDNKIDLRFVEEEDKHDAIKTIARIEVTFSKTIETIKTL